MDLQISVQVAETAELKMLMAEFEWLCELLADEGAKNTIDPGFSFQKLEGAPNSELLELTSRFESRLGRYRDMLSDEIILVVMDAVLSKGKALLGSFV